MKNLTSLYIAKNFLIKFLQIATAFSLLIFFINLLDALDKIKAANSPFYTAILMAFLQIPDFLNDIAPSLILIAAIACFFSLSSKSEISIIRMSGFSLWQIIRPAALSAFVIGVLWIVAFGPLSILMTKKFHSLEAKYVKNEMREIVALQKGIWLKQSNVDNPNEELIIQAKKVYKENLEMADVSIWFFNSKNEFYKKLDAKKMLMMDGYLLLKNVTINEGETLNKSLESVTIPTNMKADFVMQKIVNNFQNVKLFSVFELPKLISELRLSGLSQTKFKVYFHSLLAKPILFAAMTMIACYFGLNHIRNQNSILMIFFGIIIGLILYIISSIVSALGSSGLISIFASTWVIATICLAIGTLLIYRKENL